MATSIRLPEETEGRLDRLAANTGRPKSFSLGELIEKNLDKLEWEHSLPRRPWIFVPHRKSRGTVALQDR